MSGQLTPKQEFEAVKKAASDSHRYMMSVKMTGDSKYLTYVGCKSNSNGYYYVSAILTKKQLDEVVNLFDPDESIRKKSQMGKVVDFALYR